MLNRMGFCLPAHVLSTKNATGGQAEAVGTERDRSLFVPHKRWQERSFVKAPLADLACGAVFNTLALFSQFEPFNNGAAS